MDPNIMKFLEEDEVPRLSPPKCALPIHCELIHASLTGLVLVLLSTGYFFRVIFDFKFCKCVAG